MIRPAITAAVALLAVLQAPAPNTQNPTPDIPAKRPNDTFSNAMPLPAPPVAIASGFDNDRPQLYRFDAKAGETWTFTVPAVKEMDLDPILKVRDRRHIVRGIAAGPAKKDRVLVFKAAIDGVYFVEVSDSQTRNGPKFAYRLLVRR